MGYGGIPVSYTMNRR
jgi:hypothetical protein